MHVPVDNRNGNPQIFFGEDELLAQVAGLVRRELNHAQPSLEGRRIDVPVKVGLLRVRF